MEESQIHQFEMAFEKIPVYFKIRIEPNYLKCPINFSIKRDRIQLPSDFKVMLSDVDRFPGVGCEHSMPIHDRLINFVDNNITYQQLVTILPYKQQVLRFNYNQILTQDKVYIYGAIISGSGGVLNMKFEYLNKPLKRETSV